MKRLGNIFVIIAGLFAGILLVKLGMALVIGFAMSKSFPPPRQPKFGYTGDWRGHDVSGVQERPLPLASAVWRDYHAWEPGPNEFTRRVYLARLGGADKQLNFRSWVSSGETPMGTQKYTNVEFIYDDPTNGVYLITWQLRGEHNVDFLRFKAGYRLYQLQPYGDTNDVPPRLSIEAIEGIKPER